MIVAIPFNVGQLETGVPLTRSYWMFHKSIRAWNYLANIMGAQLVVPCSDANASDISKFVPSNVKVIPIRCKTLGLTLWNEFKFSFDKKINCEVPIIIGDYDIVFSKSYALHIKNTIIRNPFSFGYFCKEPRLDSSEYENHNPYSYAYNLLGTSLSAERPYNAGIIYSPSYATVRNEFFRAKAYVSSMVNCHDFKNKSLFFEGFVEQLLMPHYFKMKHDFFLFDYNDDMINGLNRSNVSHLFGPFKHNKEAFKHFSNIFSNNYNYETVQILS